MKKFPHLYLLIFFALFFSFQVTATQYIFSVSLIVSLCIMYLLGRSFLSLITRFLHEKILEVGDGKFVFLMILIGQIIALCVFLIASPVLALILNPIPAINRIYIVLVPVILIAVFCAKKMDWSPISKGSWHWLLPLAGIFCLVKIGSVSSSTLGSIGLDTHHHIYLINYIVDVGYVPLTARNTNFVEAYTKGMHGLTALYTGFGILPWFSGAWLKIMPYLQGVLVSLSVAEILVVAVGDKHPHSCRVIFLQGILAIIFVLASIVYTDMAYPIFDLNNTGSITSIGIFFTPVVLVMGALLLRSALFAKMALAAFPVTLILVIRFNPAVAIPYLAFISWVPVLWILPRFRKSLLGLSRKGAAIFFGSLVWLGLTSAFVLGVMHRAVPQPTSHLLEALDAEVVHRETGMQFFTNPGTLTKCPSYDCILEAVGAALVTKMPSFSQDLLSTKSFDVGALRSPLVAERLNGAIWALFLFCVAILFFRPKNRVALLYVILFVGLQWSEAFKELVLGLIETLIGAHSLETSLLIGYGRLYSRLQGMVNFTLLLLIGATAITVCFRRKDFEGAGSPNREFVVKYLPYLLGILICIGIRFAPARAPGINAGWGKRTDLADIVDFRRLETQIPPNEKIMVDAEYHFIGQHWFLPDHMITNAIEFGRRQYVFDAFLGAGYNYQSSFLTDGACHRDQRVRAVFREDKGIRWLIVGGKGSNEESFYRTHEVCGLPLADLGVEFPPALTNSEATISFYKFKSVGSIPN